MNKIIIKGIMSIVFMTIFLISLNTCFNDYGAEIGILTINMGGNARSAIPWPPDGDEYILDKIIYEITLIGNEETKYFSAKGGDTIRATVSIGLWNVVIKAFFQNILYATGENSVDVKAGQNNAVTVQMRKDFHPSTYIVTIGNDSGMGSLRQTILDAPSGSTIILSTDVNTTSRIDIDKEITIVSDSNNRSIFHNSTDGGYLFYISSGGILTLGSTTGGTITLDGTNASNANGIYARDTNSTIIINATAIITGFHNQAAGGGIGLFNEATAILNGGTIKNNSAGTIGGGVRVSYNCTFIMNSGTITNNIANEGGGVHVQYPNGTFTMNGGTIIGNTATDSGGGVYVNSGCTFDGTIGSTYTTGTHTANTANIYDNMPDNVVVVP